MKPQVFTIIVSADSGSATSRSPRRRSLPIKTSESTVFFSQPSVTTATVPASVKGFIAGPNTTLYERFRWGSLRNVRYLYRCVSSFLPFRAGIAANRSAVLVPARVAPRAVAWRDQRGHVRAHQPRAGVDRALQHGHQCASGHHRLERPEQFEVGRRFLREHRGQRLSGTHERLCGASAIAARRLHDRSTGAAEPPEFG